MLPCNRSRGSRSDSSTTQTKLDAATVHDMALPGLNPNGVFNQEAMVYCYQFFREQGLIPEPVSDAARDALWGTDLAEEVLAEIGRVPEH